MEIDPSRFNSGAHVLGTLRTLLSSRWIGAYAAALALSLTLHSLWGGWHFDDYFHRAQLLELELAGAPPGDTSLFGFVQGDVETTRALMDAGLAPWWILEELRWKFWRPLASATHALDYAFWPDSAMAMHAHSLLWFVLLILAVSRLYRRFLGPTWVAGFAILLYAVDDARGIPAAWIANRNSLLAGVFCALSLCAHDRWRRDAWRPGAIIAPLSFGLSLLSAELGVATLAYLGAYAVFLDRGSWARRAATLGAPACVAALWLWAYHAGGYGTSGSGVYTNALSEPLAFLEAFCARFPVLLLDQIGLPVSALYAGLSPRLQSLMTWSGVALGVLVVLLLTPLLRQDPTARFFALGSVLSLIPVTSAIPTARLLLLSGLGAMALIARYVELAFATPRTRRAGARPLLRKPVASAFVLLHGVAGPALLPLVVWGNIIAAETTNATLLDLELETPIDGKTLVVINAPHVPQALMLPLARLARGHSTPRHLRVLAPGLSDVAIERPDPHTLVITPGTGFLGGTLGTLFRSPAHPLPRGSSIALTGLQVRVLASNAIGQPTQARFRFERPLEDAELVWAAWERGRFVPFRVPRPGQRVVLAGPGTELESIAAAREDVAASRD